MGRKHLVSWRTQFSCIKGRWANPLRFPSLLLAVPSRLHHCNVSLREICFKSYCYCVQSTKLDKRLTQVYKFTSLSLTFGQAVWLIRLLVNTSYQINIHKLWNKTIGIISWHKMEETWETEMKRKKTTWAVKHPLHQLRGSHEALFS